MTQSLKTKTRCCRRVAFATCLAALVAGPVFAGDAIEFPESDEIIDTPGVFTGGDGGFVVTVWKDGRRTFGGEQPVRAPYGVSRDAGYRQHGPVIQGGVPQQGYPRRPVTQQAAYRLPARQPPQYQRVYRPAPPKRRGVVADVATPE